MSDTEAENLNNQGSSFNSTETGYSVEARYSYSEPTMIAGQLFDNRWRLVKFRQADVGVPRCSPFSKGIFESGLLSYPAAQALRWWLHAIADSEGGRWCLETRLIAHAVKYSWSAEPVSAESVMDGRQASFHKPSAIET